MMISSVSTVVKRLQISGVGVKSHVYFAAALHLHLHKHSNHDPTLKMTGTRSNLVDTLALLKNFT